ncbi:hypothetical protein CEXT_298141, partial [Caerostris extrusa]
PKGDSFVNAPFLLLKVNDAPLGVAEVVDIEKLQSQLRFTYWRNKNWDCGMSTDGMVKDSFIYILFHVTAFNLFYYYWTQKWESYKQYPGAYTRMMSTDAYKAILVNNPKGYSLVNAPLSVAESKGRSLRNDPLGVTGVEPNCRYRKVTVTVTFHILEKTKLGMRST